MRWTYAVDIGNFFKGENALFVLIFWVNSYFGPSFSSSLFDFFFWWVSVLLPVCLSFFYLFVVQVMYVTICQSLYSSLNAMCFVLNFLFVLLLPAHILFYFVTCVLKFDFLFFFFCFCELHVTNNKNECSSLNPLPLFQLLILTSLPHEYQMLMANQRTH